MDFDKIVQKMRKKGQKVWSISDLDTYLQAGKSDAKKSQIYQLIHRLVATGVLRTIRSGIYLWNMGDSLDPEDFYWLIVKKIIAEMYLGEGIISGEKALALHLRDYSLIDVLHIIVPKHSRVLTTQGNYMLVATDLPEKKRSLYSLVKKFSLRQSIDHVEILVTAPEHALLESLTSRKKQKPYDTNMIDRWLKKNHSTLREEVFAEFLPYRYISAANRLKFIADDLGLTELRAMMIRLIDRHGKGCHLSRAFLSKK